MNESKLVCIVLKNLRSPEVKLSFNVSFTLSREGFIYVYLDLLFEFLLL